MWTVGRRCERAEEARPALPVRLACIGVVLERVQWVPQSEAREGRRRVQNLRISFLFLVLVFVLVRVWWIPYQSPISHKYLDHGALIELVWPSQNGDLCGEGNLTRQL